ncbi:uncharacterized protein MYCFIDRAFT_28574 [Pseudocercospora fijiensis CIRAD86]|uniref:Uncharacterized protein n=1 Tax=Pseudocercospora fijiensis (strain CIRAD86) TaxID=383855 RepID=N1Q9V4_PSEFD|nr:uncharacterized protein MYCFIDRAFT_28574 [Pseudocercospora fijiensis CIRAD86]EME87672.1 hypothetical protein MYCFIDRAFT_28574 [Pseudocercospora fijiensis CIRAD86]
MANGTGSESSYFPALDKCLAGEVPLISWRTAYRAVCDEESAVDSSQLENFFNDNETINFLSTALDPFPEPNARTASELDTKTAPINVSQTQNGDYNLEQIKADAKWLSKEMKIEELAALRVAIIEWQERPADQLLNTAFNGTSGLSGSLELANSALGRSVVDSAMPLAAAAHPPLKFDDEKVRRERLLNVHLSELNHLRKISADLVSRSALSKTSLQGENVGAFRQPERPSWIDNAAAKVAESMCPGKNRTVSEAFIGRCIARLDKILDQTEIHTSWPKIFADDEKAPSYIDSLYGELVCALRLLLAALYSFDGIPSGMSVRAWFSLMQKHEYLRAGKPMLVNVDVSILQLLISIISVDILKVQLAVGEIMNAAGVESATLRGSHYVNDERCLSEINIDLHKAAVNQVSIAAPAVLAWSIITSVIRDIAQIHQDLRESREDGENFALARRSSIRRASRDGSSEFEKLYLLLSSQTELEDYREDPPRHFLGDAVDGMRVFSLIRVLSDTVGAVYSSVSESDTAFICKETLLDLTRDGIPFVQYDAEIMEAILSFVTPSSQSPPSKQQAAVLAEKLLLDEDQLRPNILEEALRRYPYELSPMLRLCTALAGAESRHHPSQGVPIVAEQLQRLHFFTQETPTRFHDYELENEDDGMNSMKLTEALPVLISHSSAASHGQQRQLTAGGSADMPVEWSIPADTPGTITREERPLVLTFRYEHSALEYLSVLLSTFVASSELSPLTQNAILDCFTAADIISLFTALLSATLEPKPDAEDARRLLESMGAALRQSQDIVSIIADIFESELLSHLDQVAQEGSLELVTACAEFWIVLAKFSPERVWAVLAKSSLLGIIDGATSLASIVGGSEVALGQYHFLKACVELHALLLDDAISGLLKRKLKPQTNSRMQDEEATETTPERTMSAVLNAYQRILLDAFQNFPDWKFVNAEERCTITVCILKSFTKLLKSTYGIDVAKEPSKRLTYVLAPAASSLLSTCCPSADSSPLINTFSKTLFEALPVAGDGLPVLGRRLLIEQTCSLFDFLTVLLRTAQSGNQRASMLANGVLKSMPTLASLFASDHAFKSGLFELLSNLVKSVSAASHDPPSILAQLDPTAAKAFLQVVTQLDRPLCNLQVERKVWDFLSVVMDSKQQWFAIYLLTGNLPKSRSHRRNSDPIKGKPILRYVLDQVASISTLSPERAVGMLQFLAVAQRMWVWATNELRSHPDFLKNTLAWLENLQEPPKKPSAAIMVISARECEMASYLCEILAINLHTSLEIGDKTVLKALVPKLGYLRKHGAGVTAFNIDLHHGLASSLNKVFREAELEDFKRTSVNPAPLGEDYFYDKDIAASVFQHYKSWHGIGGKTDQGYASEFSRANANISFLHAQTALLKSWKTLATTLCECSDDNTTLQVELAKTAENCLLFNAQYDTRQPGVADVLQMRLDLAFVLVSKLVSLKLQDDTMKALLPAAWDLVSRSPVDYDVASAPEDVRYYRQLLQTLYLTVQPHNYIKSKNEMQYLPPATASCLVSIVNKTIAPGFRALCGNLHNDITLALPADFALLTALLRAIVAVPGISSVQTMLSDIIADSSLIRGALSLYSWADQLSEATTSSSDPIYGEIAVMFLLALSTVRPIAEQMALQGVLTHLASGNLSNYFRKPGGKGPFDEPQRMFVIWTEGFLPLCLNLLDAVGPPIAAEVSVFLNSFPEQLRRAEVSLQNETPSTRNPRAGAVTLGLIAEAHSLAMISLILKSDVARGAAEGIDANAVPELDYAVEVVMGLVEALSRSKRSLNDRITAVSPLEERWMKTDVTGASDNLLVQKVLGEVGSFLECFAGEGDA